MTDDVGASPDEAIGADKDRLAEVIELDRVLTEQNQAMIGQLGLIGQQPNPALFFQIQLETLIDSVFDDELARQEYEVACSLRLNQKLKQALGQMIGNLQVPGDGD